MLKTLKSLELLRADGHLSTYINMLAFTYTVGAMVIMFD